MTNQKISGKGRVLVVDDEAPVRRLVCDVLGERGYQTHSCESGEQALAALAAQKFDAIISDLRMSGLSGLDLLKEVAARHRHTAFIMITGVDETRVGIEAMKQGAADYLVKPFDMQALGHSLDRALDIRHLELEVENYRQNLEAMVAQRTKQLEAAMRRIEMTYDETLEALGAALDLRDTETAGHSRRVSRFCEVMARAMQCSEDEIRQIVRGAYLHDIGKIGIPDSILLKPAKLTPEEVAVMQTHARIGYDLVCRIAFLASAAAIVLTHQERYDGTGYPQGLMGEEIPLGARIFAIADTLDAMTSDRPYRRALSFADAEAEILRESGRQFDPRVVEAFRSVPPRVWEEIRLEVAGLRLARRTVTGDKTSSAA